MKFTDSKVLSAGKISFDIKPASLTEADYTITISSVSRNNSSIDANYFKYDRNTKELTIDTSALTAFYSPILNYPYSYNITFKFDTDSDKVENKSTNVTVIVSLKKFKLVSASDVADMIRNNPDKEIYSKEGTDSFTIRFKGLIFSPNIRVPINSLSGLTEPTNKASTFSPSKSYVDGIKKLNANNAIFPFSGDFYNQISHVSNTISADGKLLTVYYQFVLKDGYLLDDNIAYITNSGLSLGIHFLKNGKWVAD